MIALDPVSARAWKNVLWEKQCACTLRKARLLGGKGRGGALYQRWRLNRQSRE